MRTCHEESEWTNDVVEGLGKVFSFPPTMIRDVLEHAQFDVEQCFLTLLELSEGETIESSCCEETAAMYEEKSLCLQEIMDSELAMSLEERPLSENLPKDLGSRMKLETICKTFPQLDHEIISSVFMQLNNHSDATIAKLLELYPHSPFSALQDISFASSTQTTPPNVLAEFLERFPVPVSGKSSAELRKTSALLIQKRIQIIGRINGTPRKRDMCGRISELMDQIREISQEIASTNEQALCVILHGKNPRLRLGEIQRVDLHGLFVSEAVAVVFSLIRANQNNGNSRLHVVTGRGRHSSGEPRLLKSVKNALKSKGFDYVNDTGGAFTVILS